MGTSRVDGIDATAESLLESFLDVSSQGLFSHEIDGTIISWNRGAERIFGRKAEETIGNPLGALFPVAERPEIERLREVAIAGERVDRVLVEIERKDGMPIPIALSLSRVIGRDGEVAGCVVVVDELTEIRLAQAALAEVEARFSEWEARAHVARWLWDVGTDAVQWSDELHRMHGVDPLEFGGTLDDHLACILAEDRGRLRARMEDAVATGRSFDDSYRVLLADGQTRRFDVRGEPTLNSAGDVVGVRAVSSERTHISAPAGEQAHPFEEI